MGAILNNARVAAKLMRLVESEMSDLDQSYKLGKTQSGLAITLMRNEGGVIKLFIGSVKTSSWSSIQYFENAMCNHAELMENLVFALNVYNNKYQERL